MSVVVVVAVVVAGRSWRGDLSGTVVWNSRNDGGCCDDDGLVGRGKKQERTIGKISMELVMELLERPPSDAAAAAA